MAKCLIILAAFAVYTVVASSSPDEVLQIYPTITNYLLKYGATQELNCSVNTTGLNAKLVWSTPTMDGIIQREETTIYSTKYLLRSSLVVQKFAAANVGEYICTLIKDGTDISANINLIAVEETTIGIGKVKRSYETMPEETKTEPVFVRDHKVVALSCSIMYEEQVPKADVIWLKNGEFIVESKQFNILENNTLIINNPIREDAGLYTARFLIKDKKHPYDCDVYYKAGPLVLDFEKSKNIIEGDDLDLKCVVKGYPYTVVTWYKNNKVVNDSRVLLQDLDGHKNAHLLIRRAEFNDAGDYSCEAFSAAFANETSAKNITVRVKDKLAALWPFLGIVGEVVLLCTIIFIYEKRRSKQVQLEDNAARGEMDHSESCNQSKVFAKTKKINDSR